MHKMIALVKAAPGRTEELARWYDERHISDLLKVEGLVGAERHKVVPLKGSEGMPKWDFMLIYEFDRDPFAVLQSMNGLLGTPAMPTSDALESVSTLSLVGLSEGRREQEA